MAQYPIENRSKKVLALWPKSNYYMVMAKQTKAAAKPAKIHVSLAVISPMYDQLRARATAEGVTLRAVCMDALRRHLAQPREEATR
jgi:hypothetical protein